MFLPNSFYHVYNQGNNRQLIFRNHNDYCIFLRLYKRLILPNASTIAWCLMPNHFHFMIGTDERCNKAIRQGGIFIDPISNGIRKLLSGYARIFNNKTGRTGSLFRQKTKSKLLADIIQLQENPLMTPDYCVTCFHYIHQNPLVAGLVTRMEDWEFSSFKDYAGLRNGTLCRKDMAALYCQYQEESFLTKSYELINKKTMGYLE